MDLAWLMSLVMVLAVVVSLLWAFATAVFVAPLRMAARERALPAVAKAMLVGVPVSFVLSSALLLLPDVGPLWLLFAPGAVCAGSGLVASVCGLYAHSSALTRAGGLCLAVGAGEGPLFYVTLAFIGGCP